MNEPIMTKGVSVWVALSALLSAFVGCTACVESASKGKWGEGLIVLLMTPVFFWIFATVGAGVINVFSVSGQVLNSQVTESTEIQNKK